MTYEGIARGRVIEFAEPLPFQGQPVRVSIEPLTEQTLPDSAAKILRAVRNPPRLEWKEVDELEQEIKRGVLPMQAGELFDARQ